MQQRPSGLTARLTLIAALLMAIFNACSDRSGNDATQPSMLHVGVMSSGLSGPPDPGINGLAHAYVTIDKVAAHANGAWVDVKTNISVKVDILALSASAVDLGLTSLPAGRITQIRLHVDGTHPPYVVTKDGATFPLKVPSGEQSGIKIIGNWNIGGCDKMALTLDLDGKRSIWIHPNGNGLYILRPVIHLFQSHARIAGCQAHGCQASPTQMTVTSAAASATQGHKTTICHVPPGNPANAHTISVGNPAVPAHLAHGDYLGACLAQGEMCTGNPGGSNPGGSNPGDHPGNGNGNGNPNNPGHGGTPPGWDNPMNPHHVDVPPDVPGTPDNPPSGGSVPPGEGTLPPIMCSQTMDCPSNLACDAGICGMIPPGGTGGSAPPVPCMTTPDCPSNLACNGGICGAIPPGGSSPPIPCTATADCPSNLACDSGICGMIPPGGTGGSQPPVPCSTSLDCPSNLSCDPTVTAEFFTTGICVAPPTTGLPPIACTQTADCPSNLECSASGICATLPPGGTGGSQPPIPCATSAQCPTNLACTSGICGGPIGSNPPIACNQTADCPTNLACDSGICGAIPPGGTGGSQPPVPCSTTLACPSNLSCDPAVTAEFSTTGICVAPPTTGLPPIACTQTADCPTNLACNSGICGLIPPGGSGGSQPPLPCTTSAGCPTNLACTSGICGGPIGGVPPIACNQTADCPTNLACDSGICGAIPPGGSGGSQPPLPCTLNEECPTNLMCSGEFCVAGSDPTSTTMTMPPPDINGTTPDGGACIAQSDCLLGSFCSSTTGLCISL
jgi:uncharacterized protein DUF4382